MNHANIDTVLTGLNGYLEVTKGKEGDPPVAINRGVLLTYVEWLTQYRNQVQWVLIGKTPQPVNVSPDPIVEAIRAMRDIALELAKPTTTAPANDLLIRVLDEMRRPAQFIRREEADLVERWATTIEAALGRSPRTTNRELVDRYLHTRKDQQP